ncbi:hypothetical protein SLS56_003018 [Neofusicoccum ribis]|uniref:Uncharacterized protein n=1 Tax=Neofusicoccum ribis TaxID=45134 RepID=A0ABR3T0S8_9PEZI
MTSPAGSTKSPAFADKVARMRLQLMPIYPLPAGPPHTKFPKTVLQFHLLTEEDLDSMAAYYSQSTPDEWTDRYPCVIGWDADFFADPSLSDEQRFVIKRRKLGKFIGLRGCETPDSEVKMRLKLTEARIQRHIEQSKNEQRAAEKGWMRWYGV